LAAVPLGQHATDTFSYTVVQGNKAAETVNQSVDVTRTYKTTDHDYNPSAISPDAHVVEFNLSDIQPNIGSHPITSATLNFSFSVNGPFDPNAGPFLSAVRGQILAASGTGDPSADFGSVLAPDEFLVYASQTSSFPSPMYVPEYGLNNILSHAAIVAFDMAIGTGNGTITLDPSAYHFHLQTA
jgi:hypothetical protein